MIPQHRGASVTSGSVGNSPSSQPNLEAADPWILWFKVGSQVVSPVQLIPVQYLFKCSNATTYDHID